MTNPQVKRVLVSVTDKTGVVEFARALHEEFGAEIISTGGTAKVIAEAGVDVTPIDAVTNFPEMMDGRVKTLHPMVHGGLLAKGRLLGVQFCAILEDGLYFELARHADRLAMELRRAFETRGYEMLFDSYTNQQYPILPDGLLAQLEEEFALTVWSKVDGGHTAVRVCTSWATEPQAVQALIRALDRWEET